MPSPQTLIQHERARATRAQSTTAHRGRVAIIDPYSTGAQLAAAVARYGYESVGVLTGTAPAHPGQVDAGLFADVVPFAGAEDTGKVVRRLKKLGIGYVVAGIDSAAAVADCLAAQLGLPGNDPASTSARRDRFTTIQSLAAAGLPHARTLQATATATARTAAQQLGAWPLVVKPACAGRGPATIAHTLADVSAAAGRILEANTIFSWLPESVIVQEYLVGDRFAINSVSRDGVHRVVEIWHARRTDPDSGALVCDRMDLLDPLDPRASTLITYVCACLDAVGVAHGPAHSEVMLTSHGPLLIETGAGLPDGDSVPLMREATGTSQVDAAALAVFGSPVVHAVRARESYPYAPVAKLYLQSPPGARITARGIETLEQIPGVAGVIAPAPGARISPGPATVYLITDSTRQVDRAYAAVRAVEAADLYQPAAASR